MFEVLWEDDLLTIITKKKKSSEFHIHILLMYLEYTYESRMFFLFSSSA